MEANRFLMQKGLKVKQSAGKRRETLQLNLWCWAFMSLTVVFYVVFQGWPILSSIGFSLLDWSGLTAQRTFVGLANYRELLGDELFVNAFSNSFVYMVMVVPIELVVSLMLAYVLNNEALRISTFYRMVFFVPVVTTASIVGIIMIFIWSVQGPVNQVLIALGLVGKGVNFLGNGATAMKTLVILSVWKDCGTYMIYWLAGLQSVPKDLYEAGDIDGASRPRVFFSIVLPLIMPTAGIIAVLCTINSLKVFDLIKTLTDGGPFFKTDVIATFVYRQAFSSEMGMPRLGYASAASLLFGLAVIVVGTVLNSVKSGLSRRNML